MDKKTIIKTVSLEHRITQEEAGAIFETVLTCVRDALVAGEFCKLPGFGTFHIKNRQPRIGYNPKTGTRMEFQGGRTIRFVPGKALKSRIKEGSC